MPRKPAGAGVFVAKTGFACVLDGEHIVVNQGERVRAGHPLLRGHADMFDPVDFQVKYDVEQATAAPGELREGLPSDPPYSRS